MWNCQHFRHPTDEQLGHVDIFFSNYRIYSINRPARLLNFWVLRVGAYSRLGAY